MDELKRTISVFQRIVFSPGAYDLGKRGMSIMPPMHMTIFRCSIYNISESGVGPSATVYLNTNNIPEYALPINSVNRGAQLPILFDRRDIGYMDDQFYFWCDSQGGAAILIWEGIAK